MGAILNYKNENGEWVGIKTIKGEKGDPGPQGEQGPVYDDTELRADMQEVKDLVGTLEETKF